MSDAKLLTVEEAAATLSVVPDTVYRWVAKNKISHVKFAAKCIRIPREAVEVFVRAHWKTGTLPNSPKPGNFTIARSDVAIPLCCPNCDTPLEVQLRAPKI